MTKIHYVLFFFLQAAIVKSCANADRAIIAEGAAVEKSMIKEAEMASRFSTLEINTVKEANESLKLLENNEVLKPEFTRVKNEKTEKIKKIIDNIPLPDPDDKSNKNAYETNSNKIYVENIVDNGSFTTISKIIKYNYASNNLNDSDVKNLLEGRYVDTLKLAPQSLFNIYFKYSETFSEKVLIQMAISSNCNNEKLDQIKMLAKIKLIPTNSELFEIIRKCNN
jgi:hypothetical protein